MKNYTSEVIETTTGRVIATIQIEAPSMGQARSIACETAELMGWGNCELNTMQDE